MFRALSLAALLLGSPQAEPPDSIYWNAIVHPVVGPRAEAIAVRRDRVAAIGPNDRIKALAGPATKLVDLEGRTVVPGFIDSHGHMAGLGSLKSGRLDLVETRSFDEALARVKERVAKAKAGDWIVGGRWDQANWGQKEYPTHDRLSAISPDNPVWLTRVDGHMGLANRKAMEIAGISRSTPNPAGGEILKGADGEPNGLFVDNAEGLVTAHIRGAGIGFGPLVLAAQEACLRVGLTGVHDAGVSRSEIPAYKRLDDEGKLKIRIYAMVSGNEVIGDWFAKNPPHFGRRLTVRSCKMFIDGAMGSRGAWLLEPYSDRPDSRGLPVTPPAALRRVVDAGLRHGYQICTHAIGDRGCRETLDVYEAAMKALPAEDPRLRVEHAQNPAVADIPRFAKLGVIASMQPTHATSDMRWAESRVGPDRVKGAYAWRKFLAAGAKIASGSDFPVEHESPLKGFHAAVTRQDAEGKPEGGWYPGECMTREEALRSFTLDAAYASFEEKARGSLEAGKLADFVVLSKDILGCPANEILSAECVMTVIGGEVVYRK